MRLHTQGKPYFISAPIVGRVTRQPGLSNDKCIIILEDEASTQILENCLAVITSKNEPFESTFPTVCSVETFDHLHDGDIVVIKRNGSIQTLYRINSFHNFLLFTERCNSNCLMCSQPPKDRDDSNELYEMYQKLIPLIPKNCRELGITGGEPTLLGERFFNLLELIQSNLPGAELHCLTNGRSFAWQTLMRRFEKLNLNSTMLGIPLYADNYHTHDMIVQADGAFNQTMEGLYNLAAVNARIELRVVLHKLTIPRLSKLARYIYKNLPFVEQVVFMGLEYTGYTPHNIDILWIDPVDYMNELAEAVAYLDQMNVKVLIYNSQLCVLPKDLWRFSVKSISDWKNIYLDKCETCSLIKECGGLFASCQNVHSRAIGAFIKEPT